MDKEELLYEAKTSVYLMRRGEISLEECKVKCKPYIDFVNAKSKELAKKYHQKPKTITFAYFERTI